MDRDRLGAIRHVAVIDTPNIRVKDFYRALGFNHSLVVEHPDAEYIRALTGEAFCDFRVEKLSNDLGFVVEIVTIGDAHFLLNRCWSHFALTVVSLERTLAHTDTYGGEVVGGPIRSPDGPFVVAYIRDPAGNLVELVEPTPSPMQVTK
jgi:catechol 2,3-dioxygenase-like lactoylglutathione lyase family enzyme